MLPMIPFVVTMAVIIATVLRGFVIRRNTGDRPLAFLSAKGGQRVAGLIYALSTVALVAASFVATQSPTSNLIVLAAVISLLGAAIVIIAQVQMGRAWRIGVREGDAPLFVSHGLFRFSRNPIFVGMILLGFSIALASSLWWAWVALLAFVLASHAQVKIEEAHLHESFGAEYDRFCSRIPRWIGVR